jgi:N,N-dimethylformamidase beta subunit-like, C-terminal/PKD domain
MIENVLVPLVLAAVAVASPGHSTFNDVRGDAIEGYASEISVLPGETVHFHVQTNPPELYRIYIYRLGWYDGGQRQFACVPSCLASSVGQTYDTPASAWLGAHWPVTDELQIPDDWPSGYYLARFELRSGDQQGRSRDALFVVRAPPSRRSTILVQVPVNTWQAYNPWGGKSLYDSLSEGGSASNRVSFDRPLSPTVFQTSEWEIQLVRFLEREGYDVTYQTDVDTHRDPSSLLAHRLVIVDGHDEYWTSRIRDAFDAARDAGTNLAFVGANIGYWQVRYENDERTIVGYKSFSDPVTDPTLQTVQFRQLTPPRPECQLLGVQYDETKRASGDPPRDYSIVPAALGDSWLAGTGFTNATVLPELVGPEWDFAPSPAPESCRKPGLTTFFHYSGAPGNADAVRYVAPSGARVFSAGSLQFAWALDTWLSPTRSAPYQAIPGVQQFMRNALSDLVRPAAPLRFEGTSSGTGVTLTIDRGPDPRLRSTVVSRGGVMICEGLIATCTDSNVRAHQTYTYAAVNADEWGHSVPATTSVTTANNAPVVKLTGPRFTRRARRTVFHATATDPDGDAVSYSWRIDGRSIGAAGETLRVRFGRRGRHLVSVEVTDGYGGQASASSRITVRR